MDDRKLAEGIYQSVSHWGLFDLTVRDGLVRIHCDKDGMALGHVFESINDALPLVVVEYENLGELVIMGDHRTGLISERRWYPEHEGAMPPLDEFTQGLQEAPNVTRH